MASDYLLDDDFTNAVRLACVRARMTTLQAGVAVFYRDAVRNIYIKEQPDGRKFEVCFIPGGSRENNYRVIRELDERAA